MTQITQINTDYKTTKGCFFWVNSKNRCNKFVNIAKRLTACPELISGNAFKIDNL